MPQQTNEIFLYLVGQNSPFVANIQIRVLSHQRIFEACKNDIEASSVVSTPQKIMCHHLFPLRHRHQWQGARQLEHPSAHEDAEHVRARWPPRHATIGRHQHHVLRNATVKSGQDDAGDASAALFNPGVRHVRERCDVRHLVRHQHVISPCPEVELSQQQVVIGRHIQAQGRLPPVLHQRFPVDSPSCALDMVVSVSDKT